jgi:hypothetical protein
MIDGRRPMKVRADVYEARASVIFRFRVTGTVKDAEARREWIRSSAQKLAEFAARKAGVEVRVEFDERLARVGSKMVEL